MGKGQVEIVRARAAASACTALEREVQFQFR